jgi:hypothetical protein
VTAAEREERLPSLEQGFEHAWAVPLGSPGGLARVLDEGSGPQTLPGPRGGERERADAEIQRDVAAPQTPPRGRKRRQP